MDKAAFTAVVAFFYFAGIFSMAASIFNWEWFFSHRKALVLENILGRTGTRIFYFVLGLGLIIFVSIKILPLIFLAYQS